ncbi:MAG: hydrogenase 2 operon protein HybA [Candidatus Marinimicrobia bacterium]|nr:hydrogenase 2 operon protein HybA [Candidatus Neomarinimicrobiota bacterium]MCF7828472.1 hydrogenase 2 operon protein HybA [Candidatus Neomarinimicrobiota bacterium]MCF7881962.1 hydrogenase 2 operon protein HybA [Candidatus Neomarinimicrobiota bacterium]
MKLERRDFFRVISAGAVTATTARTVRSEARAALSQDAVGILYDATVCIGCKACEVACKENNSMPVESSYVNDELDVGKVWDSPKDLSSKTLNKIKLYKDGDGAVKDREKNGFSYIKRHCMHCIDPDCVSVCPVTALTKDPVTGIVSYDETRCCGCRYCQIACQYGIPKFEYDDPFGQIQKCQLCNHVLAEGGIPGCCEACPTGASIYGSVDELLNEAHKRLELTPGDKYDFPVSTVDSRKTTSHEVHEYVNYVYGEEEGGGTQYLILSAVPFGKLGFPDLPDHSNASVTAGLQHTLYRGMIAPAALFVGLLYAAHQSVKYHNRSDEEATNE